MWFRVHISFILFFVVKNNEGKLSTFQYITWRRQQRYITYPCTMHMHLPNTCVCERFDKLIHKATTNMSKVNLTIHPSLQGYAERALYQVFRSNEPISHFKSSRKSGSLWNFQWYEVWKWLIFLVFFSSKHSVCK